MNAYINDCKCEYMCVCIYLLTYFICCRVSSSCIYMSLYRVCYKCICMYLFMYGKLYM